ncbi:hypothetical protein IID04_02770, partial [PVC group bacterium]|nr:hypothetical protein [PVC group bacterium]
MNVLVDRGVISETDVESINNAVEAEISQQPAAESSYKPESDSPLAWIESNTGGKLKIGVGIRTSVVGREDGSPSGTNWDYDAYLDSIRLYVNGQLYENFLLEFNTEYDGAEGDVHVLDAILKFQPMEAFNIWIGRHLPPSDRSNLDGPYYLSTYEFPGLVSRYPAIFAGRDDGVMVNGQFNEGQFKYAFGVYQGNETATNPDDNLLYAGRVTVNFWDPVPGYYTTSTNYGAKEILAVALVGEQFHL